VTLRRRARLAAVRCSVCLLALRVSSGCAAPGAQASASAADTHARATNAPTEVALPTPQQSVAIPPATPSASPPPNKTTECNSLIRVINAGVDAITNGSAAAAGSSPVAELRALADQMDAVAGHAAAVELTIPELKQLAEDYRKMAEEVAAVAREMATAVDASDLAKVTSASERMSEAVQDEDPLVARINKFCGDL